MKEASYKKPCIAWFYLDGILRIGKSIKTECRLVVSGLGLGGDGNGWQLTGIEFLLDVMKYPKITL